METRGLAGEGNSQTMPFGIDFGMHEKITHRSMCRGIIRCNAIGNGDRQAGANDSREAMREDCRKGQRG